MTTKGGKRKGSGRPKGTPNKMTKDLRDFFKSFLDKNTDKVQSLFDQVAKDNPSKALDIFFKVSEYIVPRLRQIEYREEAEKIEVRPPIRWTDDPPLPNEG